MRSMILTAVLMVAGAAAHAQTQPDQPHMAAMSYAERYIGPNTQSYAVTGSSHRAAVISNQTVANNREIVVNTSAAHMSFVDVAGRSAAGAAMASGGASTNGSLTVSTNPSAAVLSQQVARSISSSSSNATASR